MSVDLMVRVWDNHLHGQIMTPMYWIGKMINFLEIKMSLKIHMLKRCFCRDHSLLGRRRSTYIWKGHSYQYHYFNLKDKLWFDQGLDLTSPPFGDNYKNTRSKTCCSLPRYSALSSLFYLEARQRPSQLPRGSVAPRNELHCTKRIALIIPSTQ